MRFGSCARWAAILALLAVGAGSSCVCVVRETEGDISLGWAFEDGLSCSEAEVVDMLVSIRSQDTGALFEAVVPCREEVATFTGFDAGHYTVHLEGVGVEGATWYDSTTNAQVDAGRTTDLGWLLLAPIDGSPALLGSLEVDWAFLYPVDEPTFYCDIAGVEHVRLEIVDGDGVTVFDQSVRCVEGPAIVDRLEAGAYRLLLTGLGVYRGASIELYGVASLPVTIDARTLTRVGVVDLEQAPGQFADLAVDWDFDGSASCEDAEVDTLSVSIVRETGDLLDDTFSAACTDGPIVRSTFVPGSYLIDVEAEDLQGGRWIGSAPVEVGPGEIAEVTVRTQMTP